jgi:hypothetical protein
MIFNKNLVINGSQAYSLTQTDLIVVKVKGMDEFKYKIPDNFQGTITISISGSLSEIEPT